ncbi:glycosyltransferase family 2 protein [Echinimonas agarilytica]|uniref:Glycosyltransferase family 2 protein n=1 Tax=Echinimonas agarilytica TaxID=1215918 RepID=A0AA41WBY6_9GAMM|nr:glycosyltransferase family 2 protein [Echinimonas agarilytica]MCM2681498.1 glycosyltransferase family 2 protein [Echinimonas agarilytica]
MKLIVQIPCYNEAETLPETYADIPKEIPGIDKVEVLIVDDGSTDGTSEVAKELGIEHIIRNKNNKGLARTFRIALEESIKRGADIIVNTDGDNQYAGADIAKLVVPILAGEADIVVGDRETHKIQHFSKFKKLLQYVGSAVVRKLSGTRVPDAVSGFRAISREAAIKTNIVSPFSYTIETIIQAGKKHLAISSVPVDTNPKTRESRLFTNIPKFVQRQLSAMVRMYAMYQPMRFFFYIGIVMGLIGAIPVIRFLFKYMMGNGDGHIQSLVLGGTFLLMGFLAFLVGLLSDLISHNRQLLETTLEKTRNLELELLKYKNKED